MMPLTAAPVTTAKPVRAIAGFRDRGPGALVAR